MQGTLEKQAGGQAGLVYARAGGSWLREGVRGGHPHILPQRPHGHHCPRTPQPRGRSGLTAPALPFPPETCLVPGGGWQKRRAGRRGANLHLLSPLSPASLASIPPPREPWEARSPSQQHHLLAAEARGLGRATPSRPESEAEHAHTLGLGTQHPGETEDWLCGTEVTNVFGLKNQAAGTEIGLPNSSLPSKTPTESLACAKHGRRVVNQTHSVPASPPPAPRAGTNGTDRQNATKQVHKRGRGRAEGQTERCSTSGQEGVGGQVRKSLPEQMTAEWKRVTERASRGVGGTGARVSPAGQQPPASRLCVCRQTQTIRIP